jgi:DNA-binding GntR family transcriptional regulator
VWEPPGWPRDERLVWASDRFFFYQFQSGYPMQRVPVEHQRLAGVLRTRDPAEARRLAASEASATADHLLRLIVSSQDRRPWPVTGQHGNEQAWKMTGSTS